MRLRTGLINGPCLTKLGMVLSISTGFNEDLNGVN